MPSCQEKPHTKASGTPHRTMGHVEGLVCLTPMLGALDQPPGAIVWGTWKNQKNSIFFVAENIGGTKPLWAQLERYQQKGTIEPTVPALLKQKTMMNQPLRMKCPGQKRNGSGDRLER